MRYLVTGAQGFTGRYFIAELLRADPAARIVGIGRSAIATDYFTHTVTWKQTATPAPLPSELRAFDPQRYRYAACELTPGAHLDATIASAQPEVVIHLAAALRDDDAKVLIRSNVAGTSALVDSLTRVAAKPLLIVGSSGSVVGMPERLPIGEDQRCAPVEPYAASKLAAEYVVRVLANAAGIPAIWARIFNIAGPGQEERHVCGRFASQAIAIALGQVPPALNVGDLAPTRDFIDVRDVARALITLAQRGVPGETYNVASGREIAVREILTRTLELANMGARVAIVERYVRAADIPRAYADITKIAALGFSPDWPIERTLADVLTYYHQLESATGERGSRTTSATSSAPMGTSSNHG